MTPEMFVKLKRSLLLHEGYRKFPYQDTLGKTTIGIGYNLTDRGLDDDWINTQYAKDVAYFYEKLCTFPWFPELTIDRQIALVDMAFMGWQRFLEFDKMLAALAEHDYGRAAYEMLDSRWAQQVKSRAATLAQVMISGVYEI